MMFRDSEAVLPLIVKEGIPVNPLIMYNIMKFDDELLSPWCDW